MLAVSLHSSLAPRGSCSSCSAHVSLWEGCGLGGGARPLAPARSHSPAQTPEDGPWVFRERRQGRPGATHLCCLLSTARKTASGALSKVQGVRDGGVLGGLAARGDELRECGGCSVAATGEREPGGDAEPPPGTLTLTVTVGGDKSGSRPRCLRCPGRLAF